MLNDADVQVDSYGLKGGHRVYRATHIPTGVFVEDSPDSDEAIVVRVRKLMETLESKVADKTRDQNV